MLFPTTFILALAQLSAAAKLLKRWDDIAEKHSWVEVPKGWEYKSAPPADYTFDLKVGMKQHGMDELIANLMEISDPSHSRYAQHLTKAEVEKFNAPHPDSVDAVDAWLAHHGIDPTHASTQRTSAGDWVTLRVTVEQAERMLGTKYGVYQHGPSGETVVRTLSYSLPKELHSHVDVVAPTTYFGTFRSMRKTSFLMPQAVTPNLKVDKVDQLLAPGAVPSSCGSTITPACLRALYNTTDYVPAATNVNKLGVAGYLNEYANKADLQTFFKKYRTDAVGSSFTTFTVNGGKDNQNDPGVEANLDIQYTTGISYPTPNVYYSTGGSPPFNPDSFTPTNTNEPYLDFLNYLLAQSSIPQVLTTSYGDDEQTVPQDYAVKVCNTFATLGSLGTSIFFSSGDEGVGGGDCTTNDGKNSKIFQPAFPASCPFVTAVGGTVRVNPEVAVSFSGGGFSRYFARPSYQDADVTTFLTGLGTKYAGLYNATGRAYPDVAAQGQNFQVVIGGSTNSVGGTSASSPTVAGIFSLLNDYRLSTGKSSLGFINPLIYSTAKSGFFDITSGSNPGCSTNGFTAGKGWDPVTGLGTPNFKALQKLV